MRSSSWGRFHPLHERDRRNRQRLRTSRRPSALDDLELAGLDVARDALVDLPLRRVRVALAHLALAEAAQLEDLEHVDEVDARGERDEPERDHDERPPDV